MEDLPKTFIHRFSDVQSLSIGEGTRIWQFSIVLAKARIGSQCNVCSHVFIENDVTIGDRVTVKGGVQLWDGITLEDDVFIGPNATFVNDLNPRSRPATWKLSRTTLRHGASIGANATVLPVTIGCWAIVAAGSIVTRDVPNYALIVGNPGRQVGWVCQCGQKLNFLPDHTSICSCGKSYKLTPKTKTIELLP
jgi:UDP-2-acetamido-3-amino-2,3-dideoxy-glucuronate N-acetyltransferase